MTDPNPTTLPTTAHALRLRWTWSFALLAALSLAACGASTGKTARPTRSTSMAVVSADDRVLVLPLREGSPLPIYENHVMCHLTGEHLDTGDVPAGTGVELAKLLWSHLAEQGVDLVPFEEGERQFFEAEKKTRNAYEPALGAELGRRLDASKVVMGIVSRYEERSGTWFASAEPAKLSLSLALVDVDGGRVTHKHLVKREQAPLTANLFALPIWLRQGFRWWDRREITDQALDEAAAALVGASGSTAPWPNMPALPPPQLRQWG